MRRYHLLAVMALLTINLYGQGIEFSRGSWSDVLAMAQKEKKLIFVDVYTSWCVPCKQMAARVFPLKEVGDVFNPAFVNYKIDAEKGEGIAIAKQYGVSAYPTYLFVNGDGVLIYRSAGYNVAEVFLKEAATAIREKDDPKPLAAWEDEYNAGKRDKDFLKGYIKKRTVVKAPNGPLLDELSPMLNAADWSDKAFLNLIFSYDVNMTFVPGGKFYQHVIANSQSIDNLLGKKEGFSLSLLNEGIDQYFKNDIIKYNMVQLLPVMLESKEQLMGLMNEGNIDVALKKLVMQFYSGTGNAEKLVPAAQDYVNNGLGKLDIAGMIASDRANYQKKRAPYVNGLMDSTKVAAWGNMQRIMAHGKMVQISYELRAAAQAIYTHVNDPKVLSQALEWAKMAENYFPHFSTEAVYAGLLQKVGRSTEAVQMMMTASNDPIIKDSDKQKLLLDNVDKIKKGMLPEVLW